MLVLEILQVTHTVRFFLGHCPIWDESRAAVWLHLFEQVGMADHPLLTVEQGRNGAASYD